MLHLVQGRSGTGKTAYVQNVLVELAKKNNKKLLYLIPEQSSFESETAFLKLLGAKLCRNVNVMSFTRLYDMVMRETGTISGTPIDEGVRKVMMSLALEDCIDRLEIYKQQAVKPQLADIMLSAVKEFKTCGISTDALREKAKSTRGTDLSKKLTEAALITDVYNAHIEKSYIDPLDNNARLEKRLAEVRFFDGYTVAVDGFSGFTAQEQKILDLILEQSQDFYITLCMDCEREDELFFTVNRTKKRITASANRLHVKVASPVKLMENHRFMSPAVSAVENGIYRLDAKVSDVGTSDVTLCAADDIFEECSYTAEQINRLVLSGTCRYKDIAVVTRNSDKYRGILDVIFENHEIPYFMSKPEPIDNKPLLLLVLSALEYTINPSNAEKLFDIAKCGLLSLDDVSIAELENYSYIWNLNGRQFLQPFTANPNGYGSAETGETRSKLEQINLTRACVAAPLIKFANAVRDSSASVISAGLYQLLLDYKIPEKLKQLALDEAFADYAAQQVRLWDILTDILNKLVLSIGERRVSLKRYYELFKLMVRSVDISDIPQTLDQVIIGTANSMRFSSPYAVFVIGAVNGEFPHTPVAGGIFNDAERRSLITMELPVYDAVAELFLQEKYLVYTAVSAPKNRLYVSYYRKDLNGTTIAPSSIMTDVKRILPNADSVSSTDSDVIDRIRSQRTAFECCARLYRQDSTLSRALKLYFSGKPEYSSRMEALERVVNKSDFAINNSSVAESLFGSNKRLSASQIEKYYMCRFMYFCTYGLKLKERRRAELGALEYGSLVHYLLENVFKYYHENSIVRLSDEQLGELLDILLQKYVEEFLGGEDDKSERFIHLYYRLRKSTQSLIGHISEELAQSEFKPVDFELAIGGTNADIGAYSLTDENGNNIEIVGSIDRVDLMKTKLASYIRIVDYKTGSKEFKLSDVLYGLNMQMLIYLSAVRQNGAERYGDNIYPGGILYMPSTVVSVTVEPNATQDEIIIEHDKKLKMSGLFLDEEQILRGMEENLSGRFIPIKQTKSGTFDKNSAKHMVSKLQLDMVFDKVEQKIKDMSTGLDKGNIAAVPVKESYDACKFCAYSSVCGHTENDKCQKVYKWEHDNVVDQLEQEHSKKEGENNG
ncbi:MAG: PD-(D/E)XK nuclease family protein [Lachnospiraceae bacterium]|nr:PD-(D/E)XK nuclease family protein [Lachnospiraceae bacterium]